MRIAGFKTVLAAFALACVSATGNVAPSGLRCELLSGSELSEISSASPHFSWIVPVTDDGSRQTSYQIQLVRAIDGFDRDVDPVWDSGGVQSDESLAIEYDGNNLETSTTFDWRVRIGIEGGELGHWSQPQRFKTAAVFSDIASRHPTQTTLVDPVMVTELEPGRVLIDFGKVAFGYVELDLVASEEGEVVVHFGERGSVEGVLRDLDQRSSVRYYEVPVHLNAGHGVYGAHPPVNVRNTKPEAISIPGRFGRVGPFRYVEIEANGIELSKLEVKQIALHTAWNEYASFFRSSSLELDALWDLCKYSMKATSFAGVYVDGDRERIPYEADSYINMLSHYAVDAEYAIGRYTHEYLMDFETWPTEWKQHSVMMAWADFMYTGDLSSIRRTYDRLKKEKTMEYLSREDGLMVSYPYANHGDRPGKSADIVDWPPVERDGYVFKEVNTVVNSFHYLNLLQMAELARALGKEADAEGYLERATRLYQVINDKLFNEETGLYVDGIGTDHSAFHANLFPLAFGLVPEGRVAGVASFIESKGLACSVYAAQYLLEALYQGGREDVALHLMTMKGTRSWQNMLEVGSTITLEAWDDSFKPNQDWNHAWGAAPGNAIARFLLGVRPLTPGFEKMLIAPRPGTLEFVEGRVPTIRGPVDVSIEQVLGVSMSVVLSIPGNTEPTVSLKIPADKRLKSIIVDGETPEFASNAGIVTLEGIKGGRHTFELVFE